MPNYSHGTKLTLASAEEPPYLTVGTDVSAKYKGAFCEAKITDVNKHVKLRVLFDGLPGSYLIDDTDLKTGSTLETGTRIEARHPKKKQQAYVQATITKILDHSRYTVVFDDGDQCVLRRNSLCLKSGKHFAESETLDQLPLTNPEHFGNPVKVRGPEQLNNSNNASKSQNNHLLLNNKPRGKSSSSTTNSSSTTSEDSKSNAAELTTGSGRKRQHHNNQDSINDNNKRLKKERGTAQTITSTGTGTGTGRRGSTKDRKRRESINNGSKNAMGLDNDSLDSSIDSGDAYTGETDVKFELIEVGVKLMVQYGKGKIQNFYEAKVNKIETNAAGRIRYFVHYTGWNNRYDEWITKNRIYSIVADKADNGSRDGRSKHQPELNTAQSTTVSVASTTAPATTGPTVNSSTTTTAPSKSSTTNSSTTTTTPSKSSTTSSSTTTTTLSKVSTTNSSTTTTTAPSKTPTTNSSTTTTTPSKTSTTNSSTATTTPLKIEPKEKEKEVLPRTRRARQSEASTNNNIIVTTPIAQVATTTAISVTVTSSSSTTTPVDDTPSSQTVNSTKVVPKAAVESPPPAESNISPVTIPSTQVATSPISSVTVTSSTSTVTTTSVTTNVSSGHADDLIKDAPISVRSPIAQSNSIEVEKAIPSPASIKTELVPDETSTTEPNSQNTTNSLSAVDDPRPSYRFCDEIDESDCDRKISILQERIMALRQTYTALKTELADLDRRKKRPRTERSNSDHISNCSVVCRS